MAHAQTKPATPKEEAEKVMNAGIPFARKMLVDHGEFSSFAFAMSFDGKVNAVAASGDDEHPTPQQLITHLLAALQAGATRHEFKATAMFMDSRVQPPGGSGKIDAIQVGLEHKSGYCADVFFPYSKDTKGNLILGEPFTSKRVGTVFGTCK
jgi:hypothetical protein